MITSWLVWLELARDDDAALDDEVIRELTRLLTENGVRPVVRSGEAGAVLVQLSIDAKDDRAARAAAENLLRDRAHEVWVAMGLPPFTIAFVEARQDEGP